MSLSKDNYALLACCENQSNCFWPVRPHTVAQACLLHVISMQHVKQNISRMSSMQAYKQVFIFTCCYFLN